MGRTWYFQPFAGDRHRVAASGSKGQKRKVFARWGLVFLWLGLLLCWESCAVRQAPPGGPEDRQGPRVLNTFPAPDSTKVTDLPYVAIEFDEAVDKSSLQGQVWLQPRPETGLRWEWKGNRVLRILWSDTLQPDQTYLITLGTGIRDLRGNRMEAPFVLAFSTGSRIAHGRIRGRVLGGAVQRTRILAYPVNDLRPVELSRPAPYFIPLNREGEFELNYLPEGEYRVFALEDGNGNERYDFGVDGIGIPPSDLQVSESKGPVEGLILRIVREDTTPPVLLRAGVRNRRTVQLRFSEPITLRSHSAVGLMDSLSGKPVLVRGWSTDPGETQQILVFVDSLEATRYRGWIFGVADTLGNQPGSDSFRFQFRGTLKPDTVQPRLLEMDPPANAREVHYGRPPKFRFSAPVDTTSLPAACFLIAGDSLATGDTVTGHWRWPNLYQAIFHPDTLLRPDTPYRVLLYLPRLQTIWGEAFGDSLWEASFRTLPFSEVGEISGRVSTGRAGWQQGFVVARRVNQTEHFATGFENNRSYLLANLPDGRYLLHCWVDVNKNHKLDSGRTVPFQFAEPYVAREDTIRVRKRWTTQGIDFIFPF